MDYKKLIIGAVVRKLCKHAGKIAANAVIAEIDGRTEDATALKTVAEKLEYAAKCYAGSEPRRASGDAAESVAKPAAKPVGMTWGGGASFGDTSGLRQPGPPASKPARPEYLLADLCEALRDQLPGEDKSPGAQQTCLAALATINDKRPRDAAGIIRAFAWSNGKASATAGAVADVLDALASHS